MFSTLINCSDLANHLNDPDLVVVDCRFSLSHTDSGRNNFALSHIPGARYAHLDEDLSGPIIPGQTGRHPLPDIEQFARTLSRWGIDENVQVVAYDDMGGPFAARLWWMLNWMGHTRVAVLDGGWPAWLAGEYPVETMYTPPTPRTFTPAPNMTLLATAQDVEGILLDQSAVLVDARASERYQGIHEPIDPVAGHIPGAVSYPFKSNLNSDGTFKSQETLQDQFNPITGSRGTRPLVCYCGSGVTGAHNALSLAHAGISNVQLYAGSWSEWILDANRPIELTL